MRVLQVVVRKLIGVGVLLGGILLTFYTFQQIADKAVEVLPPADFFRFLTALVLMVVGLLAVLPLFPARRKRVISFPGAHGRVDIRLDAVENSLHRVTGKMPEVKKVNLTLTPLEDNRSVRINAGLAVFKAGDEDIRELTNRIAEKIKVTAANILGIEAIDVNVSLLNIIVDPPVKTARPSEGGAAAETAVHERPEVPEVPEETPEAYGATGLPEALFTDEPRTSAPEEEGPELPSWVEGYGEEAPEDENDDPSRQSP